MILNLLFFKEVNFCIMMYTNSWPLLDVARAPFLLFFPISPFATSVSVVSYIAVADDSASFKHF